MAVFSRDPREHWLKPHFSKKEVANSGGVREPKERGRRQVPRLSRRQARPAEPPQEARESRRTAETTGSASRPVELAPYPLHEEVHYARLALWGDGRSLRDPPPLAQAPAAACRRCVLRLEHRMPSHGGLPPVVWRAGWRKPCSYEVLGMASDRVHALVGDVLPVRLREPEPRAELRLRKPLERRVRRRDGFTSVHGRASSLIGCLPISSPAVASGRVYYSISACRGRGALSHPR